MPMPANRLPRSIVASCSVQISCICSADSTVAERQCGQMHPEGDEGIYKYCADGSILHAGSPAAITVAHTGFCLVRVPG